MTWLGMRMEVKKEQTYKQSLSFFLIVTSEGYIPTKNCLYYRGVLAARKLWFSSSEIKLLPPGPDHRGFSPHAADKL